MDEFLAASKAALPNLDSFERVRVILGNPTCDLDSTVCALAQGFYEYLNAKETGHSGIAVIPVMNIPERELRVKTEVTYYLEHHEIPLSSLTFRDQIDLRALKDNPRPKLEVTLVDHHNLPDEDSFLVDSVVEIIDHRPHDHAWPWPGRALCLEIVGSCATLVGRNLLGKQRKFVDAQLASLLRGPILIDTANFSKEADRATPVDFEVIDALEEAAGLRPTDRTKVYNDIVVAKSDISKLTVDDLLIRDLKITSGIPIVGLPLLTENFLSLKDALGGIKRFAESRSADLVVIIGLQLHEDKVARDIGVFSSASAPLKGKILEALTSAAQPTLELTLVRRVNQEGCELYLYRQGNLRASRKQILPIVRAAANAN